MITRFVNGWLKKVMFSPRLLMIYQFLFDIFEFKFSQVLL